jgi:hypothetical protein
VQRKFCTFRLKWQSAAVSLGLVGRKKPLPQVSAPTSVHVLPDFTDCQQRFFETRFF